MRNSITAALMSGVVFAGVIAQAGGAMASGPRYVVVNTNASVAIQQVYAADASETDPWRAANMNHAIAPGTQSIFTMSTGGNCFYDIKVRFSDGAEQTFNNVNVCRGDRVIAS